MNDIEKLYDDSLFEDCLYEELCEIIDSDPKLRGMQLDDRTFKLMRAAFELGQQSMKIIG